MLTGDCSLWPHTHTMWGFTLDQDMDTKVTKSDKSAATSYLDRFNYLT